MSTSPHSAQPVKRLLGLTAVLISLISIPLSSSAAPYRQSPTPFATLQLPSSALQLSADIGAAVQRPAGVRAKLDGVLANIVTAAQRSSEDAALAASAAGVTAVNDRVQVQIVTHTAAAPSVQSTVRAAGGEVTGTAADNTILQAWLPVDQIEGIAASSNVYRVRRPATAIQAETVHAGNSTPETLGAFNVPAWHAAGFKGGSVKVGIIDGDFKGYRALLGTDLPAQVTVRNFVDGQTDAQVDGVDAHGTACAEIIHDIAPDARLYLAKINTDVDFLEAVDWMIAQDVDIVSMSIGWLTLGPGDGTSHLATALQRARAAGILPIAAAGNEREQHWGGAFTDANRDGAHEFATGQSINVFGPGDGSAYAIPAGYPLVVEMRWDNWSAPVNQDYDLYLLRWNGSQWQAVGGSEFAQDGRPGQVPVEYAYAETSGSATAYGFAIERYNSTRNVHFEVFAPAPAPIDKRVATRSLSQPSDASSVVTVAALDANAPYRQEPYSSEGPANGPGGLATGGIAKPNLSGFANVSTQSYGQRIFNGTSSATPHVAGAAALVYSAFPGYTPDHVQTFLQGRTTDMGAPGRDAQFGFGRVQLGAEPKDRILIPFAQR